MMSIVEEMQVIADLSESSREHFCRGGRLEVSEFFKKSIDELNSYSECPTIGPSAKRFVDMLLKQKFELDYFALRSNGRVRGRPSEAEFDPLQHHIKITHQLFIAKTDDTIPLRF